MMSAFWGTLLGLFAAAMTSLSYIPQALKAAPAGSTGGLSLKMLLVLFAGLCLWVCYGVVVGDLVIVLANAVGGALVAFVLICKVRDLNTAGR